VLTEQTRIVQSADFKDHLDEHPAARGLPLIISGFPLVTKDDQETAERASFIRNALYAGIAESHNG
jgi:hypothetical protein